MCIFLSSDNQIIFPHLNHLLKSYYYTTGFSTYAYDAIGQPLDMVVRSDLKDLTPWLNHVSRHKILHHFNCPLSRLDSLLIELTDDLYTIAAPVFVEDHLKTYFLLEPFFIEQMTTVAKKDFFHRTAFHNLSYLSFQTIQSLMHIHRDRLNYLGQLFYHLMSHSIYIGQQHFQPTTAMHDTKWAKSLSMACFQYTDGFINLPVIEQISKHLINKDIKKALNTYKTLQTFFKLPCSNQCPFKLLKYQFVSLIIMVQYHLSNHFKAMGTALQQIANQNILELEQYNKYSHLLSFGESILERFYETIRDHQTMNLSPNILLALEYIHNHYMKNILLSDIAASIPMNETYLSTQFKQEYKMPLKQYLNQYRIEQATQLIKRTTYTITEIALMVGFDSTNYFSTVFKKFTGYTPSLYARKYYTPSPSQEATS